MANNSNFLYGVTCVSSSDCWAVGYDSGNSVAPHTLIEQYLGTAWAIVSSPSPATNNWLNAVTCTSASNCWTVGYDEAGTAYEQVLIEQFNGTSWSAVTGANKSGSDDYLTSVVCNASNDCWAVGDYAPNGGYFLTLAEHYNGSAWSIVATPNAGSADNILNGVACITTTNCWAVGDFSQDGNSYTAMFEQYNGSGWFVTLTQPPPVGGPVAAPEVMGTNNCSCPDGDLAQSYAGDPVETGYGNLTETSVDLVIPGRGIPLSFERTYNALDAATSGPLGFGWTSNVLMSLSQPGGTGPVTITQEGGAQVVFQQNGSTYAPAAPRVTSTLVQNGDGTWTFVRGGRETYTFSTAGQLTAMKDLNGYVTSLTYNGSSQLTTLTDPAGRTLSVGWTGSYITSVTDANVTPNRTVGFQYNDGNNNLTDVIDVDGGHTHYLYNGSHQLTNLYDPNCQAAGSACNSGNGIVNGYDAQGRLSSQQDQLGRQTSFVYVGDPSSASGATTTITDPAGHVVVDAYQYGLLTAKTKGYGTAQAATWQYVYDPTTAVLITTADPTGHTINYGVDTSGNVTSETDELGRQQTATYNGFNQILTQTDGFGVTTTYTYDTSGNLQTVSRPLLDSSHHVIATRTTTYNYGDSSHPGDITSMVDPDNNTWIYRYDTYGNQTSHTDPLGNKTTITFNNVGWRLTSVSPRGNVSGCNCQAQYTATYGYVDTLSQKTNEFGDIATIEDPLTHTAARHYDLDRNLTSTTDAAGNTTTYTYDLANEQTSVTRADLSVLRTDFNQDGTVLDQKDGKSNAVVTFGYDALGRVTSQSNALSNTTTFTYDGAGNQLTKQDPGGSCTSPQSGCTTKTYDAANELVGVTYSDGVTPNVSAISYDLDAQRVSMTDGTGTSTWTWDSLHRLTSFTDGHSDQVQYQYNLRGLVTRITYPGSLSVNRGYDIAGELNSVQDWLNNTTTFGYDPDGNLTTKTFPTGTNVVDTAGFNASEQQTSITSVRSSTSLFSASYGRDLDGQVSSDSSLPSGVGAYRYTQLNQLCYAGSSNSNACNSPPGGSQAYSFDAGDNLVGNNGNTQSFNTADQLCWTLAGTSSNSCSSPPTGSTTFTYNSRGDRTGAAPSSGSSTALGYDQANRLTSFTKGSTAATYAYDGNGLRMSKTLGSVTTHFVWDVGSQVPLLLGDGSSDYVYGPSGAPLEQITVRPAISRIGTASASGKTTSLHLTLPGGMLAGDQVFVASTEPSTTTVTAPSGYSTVASVTSGGTAPKATTVLFRHTFATGDASPTLTYSTSTTAQAAVLTVYRGIDGSLPIDVSATGSAAGATTVVAPAVTTTYANDELVVFQGATGSFSGGSWTAPTGTTERVQVNATANVSAGAADQALGAAGSTGSETSTFSKSANLTTVMIAAPKPPSVLFYHQDQIGSSRLLTDVVGAVRGTFTYDPYGNLTASTGSYATPFGFAGEYQDAESGLIFLRARYYDPTTGQFLTSDPLVAFSGSPYAYVAGNPLNTTDTTGLCGADIFQSCDPRCPDSVQPLGPWQCGGAVATVQNSQTLANLASDVASACGILDQGECSAAATAWQILFQSIATGSKRESVADFKQQLAEQLWWYIVSHVGQVGSYLDKLNDAISLLNSLDTSLTFSPNPQAPPIDSPTVVTWCLGRQR